MRAEREKCGIRNNAGVYCKLKDAILADLGGGD